MSTCQKKKGTSKNNNFDTLIKKSVIGGHLFRPCLRQPGCDMFE